MTKLATISVAGYKSIRNLNLDLRPLNVLIGANGAGKSNFVSVFRFLNQLISGNLQLRVGQAGGADQLLYYGSRTTERVEIELRFEVGTGLFIGYRCILVPATSDTLLFENELLFGDETAYFHDTNRYPRPYDEVMGSGHLESKLPIVAKTKGGVVRRAYEAMQSWRIYHFHDTSDTAKVKQTNDLDDNRFLRPDASNLAAYLYYLHARHPQHYRNIVETIRLAAPFFGDFTLRPNPLNLNKIKLEWRERESDAYFDAGSLSDGTLRFMSLATLLLQPVNQLPELILLDEPELGLHPYAINLLAELLRSVSEQTQVIVATQSVTLVNQFEPEDIIVVDRHDGQSVFEHLPANAIDTWLEDYGLGDLWEKNIFGGRPTL